MKKIKLITNPIKYDNTINISNISKLNSLEVNLLFSIFKGVMFKKHIVFDIDQLCEMSCSHKNNMIKYRIESILDSLISNIFHLYIVVEDEKKKSHIHLFDTINYLYNDKKEIVGLEVILSNNGIKMLHNVRNNFTILDLEKFKKINSTYVKTIFRLLSQYKHTGYFKMDYKKFIEILDVPTKCEFKYINSRILKHSVTILKDYFNNLSYKVIKEEIDGKKQHKYIEYKFDKIIYKTKEEIKYDKLELKTTEKQYLFHYNKVLEYNNEIIKNKDMLGENNELEKQVSKTLYKQKKDILGEII